MEHIEDPTEESPTRLGSGDPTTSEDEPTVPGSRTEPRRGGNEPVQEYPGEGVRSHYPTDPVTGRDGQSKGRVGSDDSAGDEGV